MVFALTLRMSQIARASMLQAIKASNEALLLAQKDEALLAEVRGQLDRAMRIAVGKPGRYTGQMAGAYRLDVIIGVGAMGEVYAAEHPESGERVAVKLLQADAVVDETLFERFRRESEISLELRHPNLVRVFDVGRLEDGSPYMVMERLEGEDLGARLRREGQLEPPEVVNLVEEVAAGLVHAHDQGVIHRDLKPHNLFQAVDEQGKTRWMVLDFGISKLRSSSNTLTREGIVGTPGYMSPEQARGAAVDHRSDLFSLAAVVYRALTGRPPFPGENTPRIMFDVVYRNPDRPSHAVPELGRDLELVLAIGLAKDADRRFQSAGQLAGALRAAGRQELDPELRARARKLVRRYPWGSSIARG
jgi:serine/threonine-protein kinase